jgi:adenylate cyclase
MTKTFDCQAIVSEEVCKTVGISADALPRTQVEIRGRDQPIAVPMAGDPTVLSGLLDPLGQTAGEEAANGRIEEFAS